MRHYALLSTTLLPLTACCASIDVNTPHDRPTVATVSPARDARVRHLVVVSAAATAAGGTAASVASVRFTLPGGESITDREPPFSTVWDSTNIADGNHMIRVPATDDQGATNGAETTLLVANQECLPNRATVLGLPHSIPDDDPIGTESSIDGAGNGRIVSCRCPCASRTHPRVT